VLFQVGRGIVRRQGKDVCLLAYGSSVNEAMVAAELLSRAGVSATVVDARFCKPLDTDLIRRCAREHAAMISIEEGSIGGFAAHVMQFLALDGLLDGGLKFRPMTLPDRFIDHGRCVLYDVLHNMLRASRSARFVRVLCVGWAAGWWPEVQADDAARQVHRPRQVRVM
jgi:deoxyxylulose-5-phosphate synthase